MAGLEPEGKVEIKVLRAKRLATLGNSRFNDKFCVKLSTGSREFITETKSRKMHGLRNDVSWNVPFTFTFASQMPNITLEVFGDDSDKEKDIFAGRTIVSYLDLSSGSPLEIGVERTYTFPLSGENGQTMPDGPTLMFSVKIISLAADEPVDDLALLFQQASDALDRLNGPTIPVLPERTRASGAAVASASSVLETIEKIADIMDELTRIHPYAKAGWNILYLTRKLIKAQMKEDDSIRELSEQLESLLHRIGIFVERLDNISPCDANIDERRILRAVASVSRDCATFIIDFCDKNSAKREIKCALSGDASNRIGEFRLEFASLEKSFNAKVWECTVLDVRQIVEDQPAAQAANFMVWSTSLLASSHRSCYPGTQMTIRQTITDWIDRVDEDVPRVLLLSGMAGTGKSTIAHTIAKELEEQGKHHTSFAFNRSAQLPPAARKLFPHIAAFLATLYPAVREALIEKKEIASGVNFEWQLRELILEPLKQPRPDISGPIVIVVDALEQSDDDGVQAGKLASLLVTACKELPANIRIFITSRVEIYVVTTLWPSAIQRLDMPESSDRELLAGVRLFIRDQLRGVPDIDELHYDNLMTTSQGLFQWAATACKEIVGTPLLGGSTPLQRYNMIVASGLARDQKGLLDSLYEDVLNRAFDSESHQLLKKVIAALFAMMEPMTLDVFRELYIVLGLGEASDVDCTLPYLPSILDGISDRTRPVQPNHTSLRDFFLDPYRSYFFCVKDLMPGTHNRAARSSLKILSASLRQFKCTLDFARWSDRAYIISEGGRISREMSHYVKYATLYFVKHLAEAPVLEEAFWMELGTSLFTDDSALPWIEIFSLLTAHKLRHIDQTPPELSGCMQLLAHIAKQPGSSCPPHIQSAAELASTILFADSDPPWMFNLGIALYRLGQIYESVAWTVMLQRRCKDGPSVTIGTGFFLCLTDASYDVVLTTAHNLLDNNECLLQDLVVNISKTVPRLVGASQFSNIQILVLPADIHICVDYPRQKQLETDWAAIRLPRGTALGDCFRFNLALRDPDTLAQGTYRQLSWIDRHHCHHPLNGSNAISADVMHSDMLVDPVASGAPIYAFGAHYSTPIVQGICNPTYGHEAFTRLTPALIRELCLWVSPGHILWAGTTLIDPDGDNETPKVDRNLKIWRVKPTEENRSLYLYVNAEDSKLYFREGSGSLFSIYSESGLDHHRTLHHDFNEVVVEDGCLVCHPTSTSPDREHTNHLWIKMDEDQQYSRMWVHACIGSECFYFQLGPMIAGSGDDNRLFSISLQCLKMYEVAGKNEELTYGYTCTEFEFVQQS